MTVDPNQGRDDRRNRRPDRLHHDDRELLENVHADVHHIRKDISEAIERSQTALLNRLSLLEAKIDKLGTGSTPGEIAAVTEDLRKSREKLAAATAPKP